MPTPPLKVLHALLTTLSLPITPPTLSSTTPSLLLLVLESLLGRRLPLSPLQRHPRPDGEVELAKLVLGVLATELSMDLSVVEPAHVVAGYEGEVGVVVMALAVLARRRGVAFELSASDSDNEDDGEEGEKGRDWEYASTSRSRHSSGYYAHSHSRSRSTRSVSNLSTSSAHSIIDEPVEDVSVPPLQPRLLDMYTTPPRSEYGTRMRATMTGAAWQIPPQRTQGSSEALPMWERTTAVLRPRLPGMARAQRCTTRPSHDQTKLTADTATFHAAVTDMATPDASFRHDSDPQDWRDGPNRGLDRRRASNRHRIHTAEQDVFTHDDMNRAHTATDTSVASSLRSPSPVKRGYRVMLGHAGRRTSESGSGSGSGRDGDYGGMRVSGAVPSGSYGTEETFSRAQDYEGRELSYEDWHPDRDAQEYEHEYEYGSHGSRGSRGSGRTVLETLIDEFGLVPG